MILSNQIKQSEQFFPCFTKNESDSITERIQKAASKCIKNLIASSQSGNLGLFCSANFIIIGFLFIAYPPLCIGIILACTGIALAAFVYLHPENNKNLIKTSYF